MLAWLGARGLGELHKVPLGSLRTLVSGGVLLQGLQDSERSVVCCSESGTFLGLGTVTGSVAIYIAFSLQVRGGGGHSLWGGVCRPASTMHRGGAWPSL